MHHLQKLQKVCSSAKIPLKTIFLKLNNKLFLIPQEHEQHGRKIDAEKTNQSFNKISVWRYRWCDWDKHNISFGYYKEKHIAKVIT